MWSLNRKSNIQLPAILKCDDCKKGKKHEQYANNRLQKLKDFGGDRARVRLVCLECTGGGPKTELKCHRCDQVLVITKFAKAQRAKDDAECLKCTKERLEADDSGSDPGGYSSYEDEDIAYGSDPEGAAWPQKSTLPSITNGTQSVQSGGVALSAVPSSRTLTATTKSHIQSQQTQASKKPGPVTKKEKEKFKEVAAQLSDSDSD